MVSSLVGHVSLTDAPLIAPDSFSETKFFRSGFLSAARNADLAVDGDLICVAVGRVRFRENRSVQTCSVGSLAKRWISAYGVDAERAAEGAAGRFAVAIIDVGERSVWLATDRFGTYPLCYRPGEHSFGFSDRADSVPGGQRNLSVQSVFNYLFFHTIPAPSTVFEDTARVPAGHFVTWKAGRTECLPYWRPQFHEPDRDDFEGRKSEFFSLIRSGVESELDNAVIGAFLSGGTDSSTVSGMLCKVLDAPARTYSIGFDAAGYDEMEYARLAARRFGTDHHEYYVTPNDLLEGIPRVATHYDQPFGNSSAVPAWICASRARDDGVTKMLAGDGGDELFGGNVRYAKQRVFGLYDHVPPLLRAAALEPLLGLPGMNRVPFFRKGASYVEQARVPMPDRMHMYNMLIRLGTTSVFERDFLACIDENEPFRAQRKVWASARADSLINRMLSYDWKYTLADNDLPKVVGTTQLAGIDVGFPLLTDELLAFSTKLPPEWKLKRFQLRWFFKEALRGFLPDEIIAKKKHGFGLPFGVWACKHEGLKAMASDALESFKQRGVVRPSFIDSLLKELLPAHPGYYGEMVWILMVMEFWIRAQVPNWRAT